jgi:hypothetical protein
MSSTLKDGEEPTALAEPTTSTSPNQNSTESKPKTARRAKGATQYRSLEGGARFPQTLLNIGFAFALILSGACLVLSAVYLYQFLNATNTGVEQLISKVGTNLPSGTLEVAINGRLVTSRVALLSCGVSAGLSFGFLGFALFLLGIKKEIDVDAEYDNFKVKLARMSPGVLVILIAAVLIGVCVTHRTPFWYENAAIEAAGEDTSNTNEGQNTNRNQIQERNLPPRTTDLNP